MSQSKQFRVLILDDRTEKGAESCRSLIQHVLRIVKDGLHERVPAFSHLPHLGIDPNHYRAMVLGPEATVHELQTSLGGWQEREILFVVLHPILPGRGTADKAKAIIESGVYKDFDLILVDLDWKHEGNGTHGANHFLLPLIAQDPTWVRAEKVAIFSNQAGPDVTDLLQSVSFPCYRRDHESLRPCAQLLVRRWIAKCEQIDGLKPDGLAREYARCWNRGGGVLVGHGFASEKRVSINGHPLSGLECQQNLGSAAGAVEELHKQLSSLHRILMETDTDNLWRIERESIESLVRSLRRVKWTEQKWERLRDLTQAIKEALAEELRERNAPTAASNDPVGWLRGTQYREYLAKASLDKLDLHGFLSPGGAPGLERDRDHTLCSYLARRVLECAQCITLTGPLTISAVPRHHIGEPPSESRLDNDLEVFLPRKEFVEDLLVKTFADRGFLEKAFAGCSQPRMEFGFYSHHMETGPQLPVVEAVIKNVVIVKWNANPLGPRLEGGQLPGTLKFLAEPRWIRYFYDLFVVTFANTRASSPVIYNLTNWKEGPASSVEVVRYGEWALPIEEARADEFCNWIVFVIESLADEY